MLIGIVTGAIIAVVATLIAMILAWADSALNYEVNLEKPMIVFIWIAEFGMALIAINAFVWFINFVYKIGAS